MGRTAKGSDGLTDGVGELFTDSETFSKRRAGNLPPDTPALALAMSEKKPAQTDAKSRLIAEYLSRFQLVTKGGLYIDGFAAPQSREHPEAWTAKRVLEIQPARLRRFWLCDIDPSGVQALGELKALHDRNPRFRHVHVFEGDFNARVSDIIRSGRIKKNSGVFALLDQRTTECQWETVRKLAAFKGRTRIEQLYFVGVAWLHRVLMTRKKDERIAEIDRWWGNDTWHELTNLTQLEIATVTAERFQRELGYKYANAWPVFLKEQGKRIAFYLIHATDHDAAPRLMRRAYGEIYGDREGSPTDSQMSFFED